MAAACTCCVNHVRCCSCLFNKEQTWSKSLRNSPKFSPTTWSLWLEQGGKKNAGEKSYKFFREGYVYDVYACQQLEDFHVKGRCYRSLRKSEEPPFLAVIFREWMVGQKFLKHTVRVREEALDIAIIFLHYCFS